MSELDVAMLQHMLNIVSKEQRPFYFGDFMRFEVDGKEYRMAHGTYRNKVSRFIREEKVEFDHNYGGTAYHTIKGRKFGKQMTLAHTGGLFSSSKVGRQTPLYTWLKNLPVERQSLHNIRLRFESQGIWEVFSVAYPDLINSTNQDISLKPWVFHSDIESVVTVHHTDTVSIALACSCQPIATNINGLLDCIEVLVRIEERLAMIANDICKKTESSIVVSIPSFRRWIGVLWHFAVDGVYSYKGEAFCINFEEGVSDIYTIYTKRMKNGSLKPRIERQEYSNNPFVDIFMQKLYPGGHLTDVI